MGLMPGQGEDVVSCSDLVLVSARLLWFKNLLLSSQSDHSSQNSSLPRQDFFRRIGHYFEGDIFVYHHLLIHSTFLFKFVTIVH